MTRLKELECNVLPTLSAIQEQTADSEAALEDRFLKIFGKLEVIDCYQGARINSASN